MRARTKKRILSRIVNLHPLLREKFSERQFFFAGQVRRVFDDAKIAEEFLRYAHALYISKTDFHIHYDLLSASSEYNELRTEVSDICFKGDSDLVGTEGVTRDFKNNRYPQKWNSDGMATGSGSYIA